MRLSRDSEVEVMKKKNRVGSKKGAKMDERELIKMQSLHFNTLLQKEQLSPEEENMKRFLMSKFYGNNYTIVYVLFSVCF